MALPKKIYVIECDEAENRYFTAYETVEEIPEDEAESVIGTYELTGSSKFSVKKTLRK